MTDVGRDPARRRRGSVLRLGIVTYLSAASGLISGPLIARAVGPEGRGEIASAVVYFSIMTVVASLGLPLAVGHALGNNQLTMASALGSILRFCALLMLPAAVVAVLLLWGPLAHLEGSGRIAAGVLLACIPFAVLGYCLIYFFIAEGALGLVSLTQAVQPVITTVAAVVLFVSGVLTVGSYLAALITAAVITPIVAVRLLRVRPRRGSSLFPLLRFGIRGYAGTLASFVAVRADQAVIGPVLGTKELGIYAISATIATLPSSLALAVAFRSFSNVAGAAPVERPAVIAAFLRLSMLLSLTVAAGIAVTSPFILSALYGRQFADSLVPLLILLPGSVAFAVSGGAASSLTATGRPGSVTVAEMTGFTISVVGLLLVVPRYGIVGAALLSTLAYFATLGAYIKFLPEVPCRALLPRRADVNYLVRTARAGIARSVRAPSLKRAEPPRQ